jgi:hypothetical protein
MFKVWQKIVWAPFWATFSQTHLVTLIPIVETKYKIVSIKISSRPYVETVSSVKGRGKTNSQCPSIKSKFWCEIFWEKFLLWQTDRQIWYRERSKVLDKLDDNKDLHTWQDTCSRITVTNCLMSIHWKFGRPANQRPMLWFFKYFRHKNGEKMACLTQNKAKLCKKCDHNLSQFVANRRKLWS